MSLRPYLRADDVPDVPTGWKAVPLKHLVKPIRAKGSADPEEMPYVGLEQITPWIGRYQIDPELIVESEGIRFDPGDVLFGMLRPYLAKACIAAEAGIATTEALVLRTGGKLLPEFLLYSLLNPPKIRQIDSSTYGSKMPRTNWQFVGIQQQLLPSVDEQRRIAEFIRCRTNEIDDLIAKKRALLRLLAEKRAALITRAVTKGLDPTAPMKPSGIDWLGDIPAHWNCSYRLKYLTTASGGVTPATANADYWRGDIPWVSPKDMKSFNISDSEDKVTELALAETSLKMIEPGAVLFVVRGMILVHTFPIGINSVPVTVNQDMKALRCDKRLDAFFLAYFLRGIDRHILSLVDTSAHGTKALRSESWKELNVPLPSPEEQRRIVSHIAAGLADIDASASLVTSAIERLSEYRAAIITKAVTGEFEVT